MYQTNLNHRSLRSALLLGAASAAAIGVSGPALAQQGAVETVVVTGSRIPQQGLYAPSPVTAVGQQEFQYEGTTDVSTLLNSLPSVYIDQSEQASNGASQTSTVDLRDIGAKRTLVLVDGSRLMPGDPTVPVADINNIPAAMVDHVEVLTGGASAVYGSDAVAGVVNFIMRKDFQGVEVNGQYSVYQDENNNGYAQNLFTTAAFPTPTGGTQVAQKGNVLDGQGNDWSIIVGSNTPNDKGNVTGYLSFRNQEIVLQSARDYSECELVEGGPNSRTCAGSVTYQYLVSLDSDEANTGGSYFNKGTGHPGSGTFVPFSGAPNEYFNFAHYQQLMRPDTRYNGGFMAHYDISSQVEAYASFMFMDDQSEAQLGPSGIFYGSGPNSGAYNVNCNNPYLTAQEVSTVCGQLVPGAPYHGAPTAYSNANDPLCPNPPGPPIPCPPTTLFQAYGPNGPFNHGYDTTANGSANLDPGQAALLLARRNVEGGPRTFNDQHESFRMKTGFKGDLGDGWSYDVYGQIGFTNFSEAEGGYLSTSKVELALQAVNGPTGPECINGAGCVPVDAFNGIGGITPQQDAYLEVPGILQGQTKEEIVSGSVTGDFGRWGIQSPWAKSPVAISLGSEYREESLVIQPDEELQSGDLEGSGGAELPEAGSYNVVEGFTEVKIPLVQEMPWVEDLTATGGYRYSSYNVSGSTSTWKAGLEWQPIDDIRFRASQERAVRAPNVLELFTPQSVGLFSGQDPCSSKGQAGLTAAQAQKVNDNCASAGGVLAAEVPGANAVGYVPNGLLNCPATQCDEFGGGNPSLKPEVSDTRTAGFVFTPRFLDGFTATVDYFDITLSQAIGVIPESTTLNECYGVNATAASQASFCPLVVRTAGTHAIDVNTGSTATSGYVIATNLNTGGLKTQGVDLEMNYVQDLANWGMHDSGSLSFNLIGTWLNDLTITPISGLGSYDCAGLFGQTCGNPTTRWRHKFRVTWQSPWDFSLSAQWRYFGTSGLDAARTNSDLAGTSYPIDRTISAYSWFDLTGDWAVRDGVDIRLGVQNIFDRQPPIISSDFIPLPATGNSFLGTYDSLGRYMFAAVTLKY